ncbi:MAG: hypothetical protein HYR85_06925 [Planctomycetes bacterium]|nr:hypothetical protein [Planctomycetota bacterium]MBI3843918.1 hypothetical protein [Planctomycetota bacterium]
MPMQLTGGSPQPRYIANGIPGSSAQLGTTNWPGPAPQPAPHRLLNLPTGTHRPGASVFFQGLVRDDRAPGNRPYSVTNGVWLVIGP